MNELYRDFIDGKADAIINSLGGTITPAPANAELYRDFLDRKFDDVITALNGSITPSPISDELYRDFIERKFDDVISGIGSYIPPVSFPTVSGSIVTFNAQYALPLKSLKCGIVATQDLHGYDHPWTGGNGKNKLDFQHTQPTSVQGVTFTTYPDGTVVANGTNISSTTGAVFSQVIDTTNLSGNYYFVGGYGHDYDYSVYFWDNTIGARPKKWDGETNIDSSYDYTTLKEIQIVEGHKLSVMFRVKAGQTANNVVFKPMLLLSTETDTTFEPYENICPISGFNNIDITANGTPYTFNFGQTVYGGEYDARTGLLTITHGYIASYNGETINEPWISSMDEYVEETTPTNGAQVVYPLSTPQTIQLPPCPIDTLQGVNNIWADTGDTTLQYIKIGGNT